MGAVWLVFTICSGAALGQDAPAAAGGLDALSYTRDFQQLLQAYIDLPAPPLQPTRAQVLEWQQKLEPLLDGLIQRSEDLANRSGQQPDVLLIEALCRAKRSAIYLDQRRTADLQVGADEAEETRLKAERAALARRVSDEYAKLSDLLARALGKAEALRDRRETRLVQGVVQAQSAIVLDRTAEAAAAANEAFTGDPQQVRMLLDDAEGLLRGYLEATPRENGLEWVRGRFYLGVVQYRRALKVRVPGEEYYTEVDGDRIDVFNDARAIFKELSDPAAVLAILKPTANEEAWVTSAAGQAYAASSFAIQAGYSVEEVARYYAASASLYLGLTAAIDPALAGSEPEERYLEAKRYLDQALQYDTVTLEGGAEAAPPAPPPAAPEAALPPDDQPASQPVVATRAGTFSLTGNTIPLSYEKILTQLQSVAETPVRQPLNDFTFSLGAGIMYDTNPTLNGRATLLPRGVERKEDVRFPALLKLSYVADLDVFDPGNESLRRWQVLFEGRTTSIWGLDIPEFNQQDYGGTVNLRYEIVGPETLENIDGIYAHVRYDYDEINLDNDAFLMINRVRPMIQVLAYEQLLDATVYFAYEYRSYSELLADERFDRTGDYFFIGADARVDLGEWIEGEKLWGDNNWGPKAPRTDDPDYRRPLELYYNYEFLTASTVGTEFDYSSHTFVTGIDVPLPWGIDFAFGAYWEWQDYRNASLLDRQRRARQDFVQEYGFRLERPFYLTAYDADFEYVRPLDLKRVVLTAFGDIRFVIDDSNTKDRLGQIVYEYNRVLYTLGVRVDLN